MILSVSLNVPNDDFSGRGARRPEQPVRADREAVNLPVRPLVVLAGAHDSASHTLTESPAAVSTNRPRGSAASVPIAVGPVFTSTGTATSLVRVPDPKRLLTVNDDSIPHTARPLAGRLNETASTSSRLFAS